MTNDDKRADIRWQHSANDWVNQILLAYQNTNSSSTTTSASPQSQYTFFPNPASNNPSTSLIQVGGPGSGVGAINRQKGLTLKDDFTFSDLQLDGDHTLRPGFSYGNIKLTTANASADLANATYYYAVSSHRYRGYALRGSISSAAPRHQFDERPTKANSTRLFSGRLERQSSPSHQSGTAMGP